MGQLQLLLLVLLLPLVALVVVEPGMLQRAATLAQHGQLAAAAALYRQALRDAPVAPSHVHRNLGSVLTGLGDLRGAEASFRHALEQSPADAQSALYRAAVLAKVEPVSSETARAAFRLACSLAPSSAAPHAHFGDYLRLVGAHAESERAFAAAAALSPADGELHFSHGRAAHDALAAGGSGRGAAELRATATRALHQAALLRPSHAGTWARVGVLLWESADLSAANRTLLRAVALRPADMASWQVLGAVHQLAADDAGAVACHERAVASASTPAELLSAQLGLAVALPALMPDAEQVVVLRRRVEQRLAALLAVQDAGSCPALLHDPSILRGLVPPPYLPYWLDNDGAFAQLRSHVLLARVLRLTMPALAHVAPHLVRTGASAPSSVARGSTLPIRVGFVSSCFAAHTLSKMLGSVARGLADSGRGKRTFNITLITFSDAKRDEFTESLVAPLQPGRDTAGARIQLMVLPSALNESLTVLGSAFFDVLVFNDLALSRSSYFVAAARLAPVQVLVLNNGMTSGFADDGAGGGVDYYVEADAACAEPRTAATHYMEQLVRFNALPFAIDGLEAGVLDVDGESTDLEAARSAALVEFGLIPSSLEADDLRLYMCLQSPSKLHPAFDEALLLILFADAAAVVVLLRGVHMSWQAQLLARLSHHPLCQAHGRCGGDDGALSRVRFVREQPHARFVRLASLASVHLDPFPFGGGLSSANLLSWGLPVVTLPTAHRSGRLTAMLYALLEMPGDARVVASDVPGFVRAATSIAGDTATVAALTRVLRERRHKFADAGRDTLDEWAMFLGNAAAAAAGKSK